MLGSANDAPAIAAWRCLAPAAAALAGPQDESQMRGVHAWKRATREREMLERLCFGGELAGDAAGGRRRLPWLYPARPPADAHMLVYHTARCKAIPCAAGRASSVACPARHTACDAGDLPICAGILKHNRERKATELCSRGAGGSDERGVLECTADKQAGRRTGKKRIELGMCIQGLRPGCAGLINAVQAGIGELGYGKSGLFVLYFL